MPLFPLEATEKPPNSCKIPLVVVAAELSICFLLINNTDDPTLFNSTSALLGVTTISPKSSLEDRELQIKNIKFK